MDLVRKQTYITPAQDKAVKQLAQQQGKYAKVTERAAQCGVFRHGSI